MKLNQSLRKLHRTIAPIVLLPLLITVFTGVTYRISKDWFGLSRDQVHFLMVLHEGEYFGHKLESVYVLLNGLGLLWMLATGGAMLFQNLQKFFKRSRDYVQSKQVPQTSTDSDSHSD
ncbi:MAG: PepSY domain-containing protein [Mastigocoleus sp. MO_167.B18]|uniref:PepSY domain-containing protein n=1 Tax=Mastigocoleus sp. MO_188.B34 TaxID=3036635 RepID=UPI00263904BF|nr:PepSY domain-containing protein [Mastigocoleus sp. MO_188.B34]MDJ0697375.1 PepSY domain-containing protein [Mastigocoleus sp. MO_188.B34]MDJ0772740.1 PepSY domain-containing protein [Mastigocoleus sp. MO_167.B18]